MATHLEDLEYLKLQLESAGKMNCIIDHKEGSYFLRVPTSQEAEKQVYPLGSQLFSLVPTERGLSVADIIRMTKS